MNKSNIMHRYNLLMDNCQEIVLFFNEAGNIIYYNKKAIEELGYYDDLSNINIADIFRRCVKIANNQLIIAPRFLNHQGETVAYRKNQTCFPVKLKISINKGKEFSGICCAINITDKKDKTKQIYFLKRDLRAAKKIKSEIISNVTHELRTPINGIMGLINNLRDTELTTAQLNIINIMNQCCLNMNNIISDMLDFSNISNGDIKLDEKCFHFPKFIEDITNRHKCSINKKGLKFLINVSDDIPTWLVGDELRLGQIVNNLLSNAIKFTSIGQIAMEVAITDQTNNSVELFFVIMDTGIGIKQEDIRKIFKSFVQGDGSITRKYGGTGIGLAICKKLVKAMNGRINVESDINIGSTFSFSVWLKKADDNVDDENKDLINGNINYFGINCLNNDLYQANEKFYVEGINENRSIISDKDVSFLNDSRETSYFIFDKSNKLINDILDLCEKLIICIEMRNWEKAEMIAEQIRNITPKGQKDLDNNIMRLLLSVRKEDYNKSLSILEKITSELNEV